VTDLAPQSTPAAPAVPPASAVPTASAAPRASAAAALRGLLRQPRFLVAAGLLLVCAVGFNAAAQALQLHFRKQRLELRVPALDDKSAGVKRVLGGHWVQVGEDRPMSADLEKTLGTTQYLNRVYVDSRAARKSPAELAAMTPDALNRVFQGLASQPEAIVRLHVAYYSGLVDTVAHVPDRCMVADGFRPTNPDVLPLSVPAPASGGAPRELSYRFITFEDTTAQARVTRNVGYLFHVNGEYTPAPLDVRKRLQKLTERFGYYAKVEVMTEQTGKADPAAAAKSVKVMNEFLAATLPEVERCLPDWAAATTGQPTPPPAQAVATK
jgi:hypothetical protein